MAQTSTGKRGKQKKSAAVAAKPKTKKRKTISVKLEGSKKKKKTTKTKRKAKASQASTSKASARAAQAEVEQANKEAVQITNPPLEVLRVFRNAAKQNKKRKETLLREAKAKQKSFLAKPPRGGKQYRFDLRIHSPASENYFSTGGVETGAALVRLAAAKKIDIIGITDFYHAHYVDSIVREAEGSSVTVLPGFVFLCAVAACDSVPFVALFDSEKTGEDIFSLLDALGVPKSARGSRDYKIPVAIDEAIGIIESAGGFLIPTQVDKTPHTQLAIPALIERYGFHAFDLIHPENTDFFQEKWPDGEFSFFSFSNATSLAQVGCRTGSRRLSSSGYDGLRELFARRAVTPVQ